MDNSIKLVICGDGAVGKTCLLIVYASGDFPRDYVPTIFDNYNCDVDINGKETRLSLWDTAGQEEFDELRPLSYTGTNVFLVCYNTTNPISLENVQSKWIPEIKRCNGNDVKFILVGTQADIKGPESVSTEKGRKVAKKYGAFSHVECSAKEGFGVQEVFHEAINCHLKKSKKNANCTIL